jgi:hypothetical protein
MKYYLLIFGLINFISCNSKQANLNILAPHHAISWHELVANDFYVEKDSLGIVIAKRNTGDTTFIYEFNENGEKISESKPVSFYSIIKVDLDSTALVNFFTNRNCELISSPNFYQPSNSFSFYVKCKHNNLFFSVSYMINTNNLQISYDYPSIE